MTALGDSPPSLTLANIRGSFEGGVPSLMATCDTEGVPNVTLVSQVYYVDNDHVALSFQFFNKTRRNVHANPQACVQVMDPLTGAAHRLHLHYVRTEVQGSLYQSMRAQLAGIASHLGMTDVYSLRGSDVYAVTSIEAVDGPSATAIPPRSGLLNATRRISERLARCTNLDDLVDEVLAALVEHAGIRHGMVLMADSASRAGEPARLFTLGSVGYALSGVGSEVLVGEGVIGVAAAASTPVRINRVTPASLYSHAVRLLTRQTQAGSAPDIDIPFPGLTAPQSQLAVPVIASGLTLGVLFVESQAELAFDFDDEDLLVTVAAHFGAAIGLLKNRDFGLPTLVRSADALSGDAPPLVVKHYAVNDSVFVNDVYLIKGVAGAVLWKLLKEHSRDGRTEFTNRELRLDTTLGLPDVVDNLEARLLLLRRRLQEQNAGIRIARAGRGRLCLGVSGTLELLEMDPEST
jgi:predicted pyridoxine 5'-phosphate oxidase superfamily flavin-nucleotide-binding protein